MLAGDVDQDRGSRGESLPDGDTGEALTAATETLSTLLNGTAYCPVHDATSPMDSGVGTGTTISSSEDNTSLSDQDHSPLEEVERDSEWRQATEAQSPGSSSTQEPSASVLSDSEEEWVGMAEGEGSAHATLGDRYSNNWGTLRLEQDHERNSNDNRPSGNAVPVIPQTDR